MSGVTRILGIDPGSRITGFGIIDSDGRHSVHVASGCIRTAAGALPLRLQTIFAGVQALVLQYQPGAVAVEQVFMHRNADSALKLGQARAAAICATFGGGAEVFEYAARAVKQAIAGIGNAEKSQDAADALAVALCHAHTQPLNARLAGARRLVAGMRR